MHPTIWDVPCLESTKLVGLKAKIDRRDMTDHAENARWLYDLLESKWAHAQYIPPQAFYQLAMVIDDRTPLAYVDFELKQQTNAGQVMAITQSGRLVVVPFSSRDSCGPLQITELRGHVAAVAGSWRTNIAEGGRVEANTIVLTIDNGGSMTLPLNDEQDGRSFLRSVLVACFGDE
jgi:hypothetical protein